MRNRRLPLLNIAAAFVLGVALASLPAAMPAAQDLPPEVQRIKAPLLAEQTQPTTAPATTHAADTVIAEWQYIDGEMTYTDREAPGPDRPMKPVAIHERRTLVRIHDDGRVEMSGDLMLGGGRLTEGKLSPAELQRLKGSLRKFMDGIEGTTLQFSVMHHHPWHEIKINLGDDHKLGLQTSMRIFELERWEVPSLFSAWKTEFWHPSWEEGDRYTAAQTRPISFITHRMIWTEIEAEVLRAAAQSLLPDEERRPPVQSRPPALE